MPSRATKLFLAGAKSLPLWPQAAGRRSPWGKGLSGQEHKPSGRSRTSSQSVEQPVGKIFHLGDEAFPHCALPGRLQGSLTTAFLSSSCCQAALPVPWGHGQVPHSCWAQPAPRAASPLSSGPGVTWHGEITTCRYLGQVFCNRHRCCLHPKGGLSASPGKQPGKPVLPPLSPGKRVLSPLSPSAAAGNTHRPQHPLLQEHPPPLQSPGMSQHCRSESRRSLPLSDDSLGPDRAQGRSTAMETRGEGSRTCGGSLHPHRASGHSPGWPSSTWKNLKRGKDSGF